MDVAGIFAVEDAAVILSCLHHHGKVGKLIGTVVNVQTVEDVDKYLDALRQSLLKELADDSIVNVEL